MATVKLNKQVSDKVRELNALGTFLADIRLGAVARKLSELPVDKALEVLNSVVEAAEGGDESAQQDPTVAVCQAVTKKVEEDQEQEIEVEEAPVEEAGEEAAEAAEENPEPWNDDEKEDKTEQKWPEEWDKEDAEWNDDADKNDEKEAELSDAVRQRVLKLNRSGKLCSEIDLSKVESGLAQLSEPIALQLLKDIFENADMVDKPNHLIGDASRKILLSGRGTASEKVAHQIGNLMRRIRWVNSNVSLSFPLHMGNVLDILQPLHHADAMQVLKKLVQNADDIDAPQSWLRKEAKWVQDNPEKAKEQRKGGGKGKSGGGNNKWDKKDNKWDNNKDQKWDNKKDQNWDKKAGAGGTIRANAPVTAYGKNDNGGPSKWQKTGNSWDDKKAGNDKKPWKEWGKKEDKNDSWSQDSGKKKSWR